MAAFIVDEALVAKLRDRLVRMDQAMGILQDLRKECVLPDEDIFLDRIIEFMQSLRGDVAGQIEAEISGEDEGWPKWQ